MQENVDEKKISPEMDGVRGAIYTKPSFWEIKANDAESNVNPGPEIIILIS